MTTDLAPIEPQNLIRHDTPSAFGSIAAFENVQRMAKLLCGSSIVPQSYRDNIADTVIALEMANRIGANPLAVMQNLYLVHGRPAWSSQFLISCVNASGKFTPLRYRMTGEKGSDSWGCVAWAKDRSGELLESPEVTIGISKAEGWYTRNGSKWKTMPELMLRYRAATLFARNFAPELTMGIHAEDEIVDIGPVVTEPRPVGPRPIPPTATLAVVEPVLPVEVNQKPERRKRTVAPVEPVAESEPEQRANGASNDPRTVVAELLATGSVSFDDFRDWLKTTGSHPDPDCLPTFEALPLVLAEELIADNCKRLRKCITIYGQLGNPARA